MLNRDEVRAAIRFQKPPRPPLAFTKWWGEGLAEQYGEQLRQFDRFEEDVVTVEFPCPSFKPRSDGFCWRVPAVTAQTKAIDASAYLPDWDDLPALMMSPAMFREFIKPYYTEIWGLCRAHDVDPWLHTCGNVTEIIGDLIECGLSVLHPIQKHTMDWAETAEKWRGKIAFWVGMDVQDTLIRGTPEDVRREVRLIRDTFDSPNGGLLYASGNGIVRGTPLENIEAFLDECLRYGNG